MKLSPRSLYALIRHPTVILIIGLGLSGAAGSAFLAVVNASFPRSGPDRSAGASDILALTGLNFLLATIVTGMMAGSEQEMARSVTKAVALGVDPTPVVRSQTRHAGWLIGGTLLATCALSPVLVPKLLGNHWVLFADLLLGLVGGLAIFPIRGVLTGRRDYPLFSATLIVEGLTRLIPGFAILALGWKSVWLYGLTFALGGPTLAAVFGVLAPKLTGRDVYRLEGPSRAKRAEQDVPPGIEAEFAAGTQPAEEATSTRGDAEPEPDDGAEAALAHGGKRLTLLTAASLANQLLFNAIPLLVAARYTSDAGLNPSMKQEAAAVASAVGLTRLGILILVPLQAPLLPRLTAAAVHGRYAEVRQRTRVLTALCAGVGLLSVVCCWLIGPWVLWNIMRAHAQLPGHYLAALALGTTFMMIGMIIQSTLLAIERHSVVLIAWIVGVVVTVPVFLVGHSLLLTTGIAAIVGPFVAMLIMAVDAWAHTRGADGSGNGEPERPPITHPAPSESGSVQVQKMGA
jgi:hypothetical protein